MGNRIRKFREAFLRFGPILPHLLFATIVFYPIGIGCSLPKFSWAAAVYERCLSHRNNRKDGIKKTTMARMGNTFERVTEQYAIPPAIFWNLIHVESSFEIEVRNPYSNARGPNQITPILAWDAHWKFPEFRLYPKGIQRKYKKRRELMKAIHGKLNIWPLYNPDVNLEISAWFLRCMYDKYKDWKLATIAYNAGPGTLDHVLFAIKYSNRILLEEEEDEDRYSLRLPYQ